MVAPRIRFLQQTSKNSKQKTAKKKGVDKEEEEEEEEEEESVQDVIKTPKSSFNNSSEAFIFK